MFDEPESGYANGGIVAFAEAGAVRKPQTSSERMAEAYRLNPEAIQQSMASLEKLAPRETKYSGMQRQQYEREMSPEAQAAQKKQDMYMTLAQIGAKMATTPGGFLRGAATGIESALPGAQQMAKERKQDMRQAMDALAAQEGATNKQRMELLNMSYAMQMKVADAVAKDIELEQAIQIAREEMVNRLTTASIGASAQRYSADASAASYDRHGNRQEAAAQREAVKNARDDWENLGSKEKKGANQMEWIAGRASAYYGGPIPSLKQLLPGGGQAASASGDRPPLSAFGPRGGN
jgi:hypothetical protein